MPRSPHKAKVKRRAKSPARFCACLPDKLERYERDQQEAEADGNPDLAKLMAVRIAGIKAMLRRHCPGKR